MFEKLYALDVNAKVEKKQNLSYLSWAWAWAEFKKICPDAKYEVKKDEQGRCYFGDEKIGYMVYTSVSTGGITHEMWLPVMDNSNKAMKAQEYEYSTRNGNRKVEAMTMFDVNKAVMRCLTKNLAMFGLGLYIYAGEDLPEQQIKEDPQWFIDICIVARKKGYSMQLVRKTIKEKFNKDHPSDLTEEETKEIVDGFKNCKEKE